MKRCCFYFAACIFFCGVLCADDTPKSSWKVIAECHMVTLPQKAALPLIPELLDDAKVDAAWEKVRQMIDRGEATLEADLVANGSGSKGLAAKSVEEMRYPKEYEPPQIPDRVPEKQALEVLKAWPVVGITPTAYETREVGAILNISCTVSANGNWVTADVSAEHVRFREWGKFDGGRLANGEHLSVEQPYFHVMKNTTSARFRNGQRALIGVHKSPGQEKAFELFVLQVKTTPLDRSE